MRGKGGSAHVLCADGDGHALTGGFEQRGMGELRRGREEEGGTPGLPGLVRQTRGWQQLARDRDENFGRQGAQLRDGVAHDAEERRRTFA